MIVSTKCAHGEMDITTDFGSVVLGSNPGGRTEFTNKKLRADGAECNRYLGGIQAAPSGGSEAGLSGTTFGLANSFFPCISSRIRGW